MTHIELKEAVKVAMKERDQVKTSVLRGLIAACTNELVAKGRKPTEELSEEEIMVVVGRAAKQRKDSIEQFTKGGRADLVATEEAELRIIETLLPPQMSRAEIEVAAKAKAVELGVSDKAGANKLMGILMKDLKGKADGTEVKAVVDSLFA